MVKGTNKNILETKTTAINKEAISPSEILVTIVFWKYLRGYVEFDMRNFIVTYFFLKIPVLIMGSEQPHENPMDYQMID